MRKFRDIFLGNLLIIIALAPMMLILNTIMDYYDNPIFWAVLGIILLLFISYLSYKVEKK